MSEQPPGPTDSPTGGQPAGPETNPPAQTSQPAWQLPPDSPPAWQQSVHPSAQSPPGAGYGAPPGAYGPPPTQPPPPGGGPGWSGPGSPQFVAEKEARGFFAALFDYSFSTFVTPMIVKFLYVLLTVAVAIGYLFYVVVAFNANAALGLIVLLIIGPIVSIVILAFYRVTLELYISVVRMSEDIHRMQNGGRRL